jgi:hypothetical protein
MFTFVAYPFSYYIQESMVKSSVRWVLVIRTYSGGRDQEEHGSKSALDRAEMTGVC